MVRSSVRWLRSRAGCVRELAAFAVDCGSSAGFDADPERLRAALDELLDDPARRAELAARAAERARGWTYEDLFDAVRTLLLAG